MFSPDQSDGNKSHQRDIEKLQKFLNLGVLCDLWRSRWFFFKVWKNANDAFMILKLFSNYFMKESLNFTSKTVNFICSIMIQFKIISFLSYSILFGVIECSKVSKRTIQYRLSWVIALRFEPWPLFRSYYILFSYRILHFCSWHNMGRRPYRSERCHPYGLQDPVCRKGLTTCNHWLAQGKSDCVDR